MNLDKLKDLLADWQDFLTMVGIGLLLPVLFFFTVWVVV